MVKKLSVVLACLLMFWVTPVMAQVDFCEGNFDYNQTVDGLDAALFKSDFGRSGINRPCPGGFAAVQKTGQTTRSYYGDDGDLEKGVPWPNPRFTDNGNGTVTDNLTGLIWLKDALCIGQLQWVEAVGTVYATFYSGQCGLTDGSHQYDWRLPSRYELESLLDLGHSDPALPAGHPFHIVPDLPMDYWTSTTIEWAVSHAWTVDIETGYVTGADKNIYNYVWPVRGGK